jgi:hypothetical protein
MAAMRLRNYPHTIGIESGGILRLALDLFRSRAGQWKMAPLSAGSVSVIICSPEAAGTSSGRRDGLAAIQRSRVTRSRQRSQKSA